MNKTKLLWLSDSGLLCTGFSDQTKNILNHLTLNYNYDCYQLGHSYMGQTLVPPITFEDGRQLHYKMLGMGKEAYCKDILQQRIKELRPELFGILLDTFMLYPWLLSYDLSPAKTFFYYPSDGGGHLPLGCEAILKKVNLPIAMSKFAQKQVKDVHGIDSEYIPHAVELENYYPFTEEEKAKAKISFGLNPDDFVVGNVYRNQGRKFADRMFKIFADFSRYHQEAKLLLHTDPMDAAAVFDTINLIRRYKIENRVKFTGMSYFKGWDYRLMKNVYNALDVKLDGTSGEGFGITTIEAMACKVPVLITDYTTSKELIEEDGKCGELIKLNTEVVGSWNVDRGVCDIDDGVEKLEKLYNHERLRKTYGEVGRKKVEKYYGWDVVMPQWYNVLERLKNNY